MSTRVPSFATEKDGEAIVNAIAGWIDSVVEYYDELEKVKPSVITVFHAQAKPEISVRDYLLRINKYGNFSRSVGTAAIIYIDRLLEKHPEIVLTSRTVHRLLISATLVAAKFNDDVHLGNSAFAQIGGIRTVELNRLEVNFLKMCEFSLVVSSELYAATVSAFQTHASGRMPMEVAPLAEMPEVVCGLGSPNLALSPEGMKVQRPCGLVSEEEESTFSRTLGLRRAVPFQAYTYLRSCSMVSQVG